MLIPFLRHHSCFGSPLFMHSFTIGIHFCRYSSCFNSLSVSSVLFILHPPVMTNGLSQTLSVSMRIHWIRSYSIVLYRRFQSVGLFDGYSLITNLQPLYKSGKIIYKKCRKNCISAKLHFSFCNFTKPAVKGRLPFSVFINPISLNKSFAK